MNKSSILAPVFNNHTLINCRGTLMDLSEPKIMGILNLTPDSFYDGGKFTQEKRILKRVEQMLSEGSDIIDIGGQSTRPGARFVSDKTEIKRVLPFVRLISSRFPEAVLSIDTFYSTVATSALEAGVAIINDVSAGNVDKKIFTVAAAFKAPYVLMHMKGSPINMQVKPSYKNVLSEVLKFMTNKINTLKTAGVKDIIIDPGFGFGKDTRHNYKLLASLKAFTLLGYPVLAGLSRKSMICKVLKVNPPKALNGTTALNMAALINGASILRVHDIKEAAETIRLYTELRDAWN
jgi:dihydropteroate synthase